MTMPQLSRGLFLLALAALAFAGFYAAVTYPHLAVLAAGVLFWPRRRPGSPGTSHGSAAACTVGGLLQAGMLGDDDGHSLVMGRASYANAPTRWQAVRALLSPRVPSDLACRMMLAACWKRYDDGLIRVRHFVHLLTVAPAGAGKSVSMIVNNLRAYRGSCVVVDPKGELFRKTAAHREQALGHRCIRLDPFGVAGPAEGSHCLNPFDFVDENATDFAEQVQDLAKAVVLEDDQNQPHWNAKATEMLAAFSYWICATEQNPGKRTLAAAAGRLGDKQGYVEDLAEMQRIGDDFGGVVAEAAGRLTWTEGKELGSVASSLFRHLEWLMSPVVKASLARSTFDPRWLWDGKTNIYLVVPHNRIEVLAGLLRLWLACIIRLVGHTGDEKHPVLFIIDEAGHLGRQKSIETAISLMRSYGLRIWLFFQSLDQVRKCYGEGAQTIIDNCAHQQFFGLSSYDTAEMVSKRIGDATILVESINQNASRSNPTGGSGREQAQGNVSTGWGTNVSQAARKLLFPSEILTLPRDCMLLFAANLPVVPVRLVRYFADPAFGEDGTGRDRGPGPGAALLAAGYLFMGLSAAAFALSLPGMLAAPPVAVRPAEPWGQPARLPQAGDRWQVDPPVPGFPPAQPLGGFGNPPLPDSGGMGSGYR